MSGVAIVGGGPTGLSAGIYTARADRRTLVFDDGGGTTRDVDVMENVYGFPEGVTGPELVELGQRHVRKYGAEIVTEEVVRIEPAGEEYRVETTADEYAVDGVILATGADYERPAIADVDVFEGQGVSYCVECDAYFYRDRPVAVVGDENYAATEALMLLDYTDDVRILTNGSPFEASDDLRERVEAVDIPVRTDRLDRLEGEDVLEAVVTREGEHVAVDGLFVALGTAGGTDLAEMLGVPVESESVVVDPDQSTPVDRVYAAGDVTGGHQQIATSVGEGARAAINLLEELKGADYVDYKKMDSRPAGVDSGAVGVD
jgi:thioredoxin reductase (NADPH)